MTEVLRRQGYDALSFHDLGWLGEADVVWLPKAALIKDSLVITRDRSILEKGDELAAIADNNLGVVFLTGGQLPVEIMVQVLTTNWDQLEQLHNTTPRPFIRFLTTTGNLRERLHGRGLNSYRYRERIGLENRERSMNTTQFIADCLAQTHLRLMATCEGLTAEQMAWRSAPTANNIGFILWHMVRNEDGRISRTAGRQGDFERDLWATGGWFERFGQPETAPDPGDRLGLRSLAIPTPDVLISYAEAVNSRTVSFLESLDDARMDEHMGGQEPPETVGASLRHVIVHKNNHHGQIDYLRGLQEEDWDLTPGTGRILR